jgi:hypothetical protein
VDLIHCDATLTRDEAIYVQPLNSRQGPPTGQRLIILHSLLHLDYEPAYPLFLDFSSLRRRLTVQNLHGQATPTASIC